MPLVVVSNQPAAAKGTAALEDLAAVHDAVIERLAEAGVWVDDVRYCFHHPEGVDPVLGRACDCRKPRPGAAPATRPRRSAWTRPPSGARG